MIKTTLGVLVQGEEALGRLTQLKLPTKTSYRLAKIARVVREEIRVFAEQRDKLIKEMGEERESTKEEMSRGMPPTITEVTNSNRNEFFKQVQELFAVEVSLAQEPLRLEELLDCSISAADIISIGPLIEETPK